MNNFDSDHIGDLYKSLVKFVLKKGKRITVRGKDTIECINISATLTNINNHLLVFTKTKAYSRQEQYIKYLHEEIAWYESGCLNANHAPSTFWKSLANENMEIQSNYGNLILHRNHKYTPDGLPSYQSAQAIIREGKLSFYVYQSSCDLHFGFIYDIPWHCHLLKKMAHDLNHSGLSVSLGEICVHICSLHIYIKDLKFFKAYLKSRTK